MTNFKLNFLGITVADFEQSYRFFTEILGVEVKHSKPGWAAFQTTATHRWGRDLFIADLDGNPIQVVQYT